MYCRRQHGSFGDLTEGLYAWWNEQGNSDTSLGRKPGAIGKNRVRGKIFLFILKAVEAIKDFEKYNYMH